MTATPITVTIRSRWTDEPIYITEVPGDTPSGMQTRVALEKAGPVAAHILSACQVADNGCIEWALSTVRGRGRLNIDGKRQYAHRALWEAIGGYIPAGMLLCHGCDNPLCVNPEHMFVGTHEQNMADMVEKGRSTKGRPFSDGHRFHLSVAGRGRKLSEATRQAIAAGVAAARAAA
ncbi:HNH endonuclease signature motif containing protein [Castellaniella caeni]|uniref:HNH endonuclease signature motif containing protein n=1 Tax=Castellaniella caeni TaxID=266123 RepID=UPI000C9FCFD7|nr:HNH endonuclease signature motif containing protein [Castellaniella caeni]